MNGWSVLKMRSPGIRAKIILPLAGVAIGTSIIGIAFIYTSLTYQRERHLEDRASAIAQAVVHMAETAGDANQLQRFVASMASEPGVEVIVVVAGEPLAVVASSRPEWLHRSVAELPDPEHTRKCLEFAHSHRIAKVDLQHNQNGTVDYSLPLRTRLRQINALSWSPGAMMLHLDGSTVRRQHRANMVLLIITFLAAIGLSCLASYVLLQRVVIRPTAAISQVAQTTMDGQHNVRVDATSDDELGKLGRQLDGMLDEIERRGVQEQQAHQRAIMAQRAAEAAASDLQCFKLALDEHAIVAATNSAGIITHANDRFCEISKYARQELVGQTHRIINSGHHNDAFWRGMWSQIKTGKVWHGEICNRAKNGELYWVDTTIVPFTDSNDQITQYVAIRADITKRKTAEDQLAKQERQFRTLVNNIPGVPYRCLDDEHWTMLFVGDAIEELTGYPRTDFVENHVRSYQSVIHPEDRQRVDKAVRTAVNKRRSFCMEYRIVRADGTVRVVSEQGQVVCDEDQQKVRCLDGAIFDISDRKQAEQELLEERARLATFVEHAPAALVMLDRQLQVVAISRRFISDFDLPGKQVVGRGYYDVMPQLPERWQDANQRGLAGEVTVCDEDVWRLGPDQDEQFLRWEVRPWMLGADNVGGILIFTENITSLKQAEIKLKRAARLDKLTGLPNRGLFLDRLQRAIDRSGRTREYLYAVMFLDFDRFKIINDSLGHDVGDALLVHIANKLRDQIESVDSIRRDVPGHLSARLGGDEFVVLLDELTSAAEAETVAQGLLQAFAQPHQIGKHEVYSTASIGIVMGDPTYERAEDVVRDADTAMYEAKRQGKARYVVFDASMRDRVQRRMKLERDLHKAIGHPQLSVKYQPILSLQTGALYGVEALLRWQHATEGNVEPAEFVPIAEESDLILNLSEWGMKHSCRQLAHWQQTLGAMAPHRLCINLSRKQFALPDLPQRLERIIQATGVDARAIQLELTEDAFVDDVPAAVKKMESMKALGLELAIDGFGTGTSSFSSLHQFPVDVLKIDQSMLVGIEDSNDAASLIHGLAVMVKNLGIKLVAEGVETLGQVIALQELGCDYAQGHFFAEALVAEQMQEYASRNLSLEYHARGAVNYANPWGQRLAVFESLSGPAPSAAAGAT
jgi:diguanylate cyclase (GGDEF)-like protein/PAS domain S-box-containing protein